MSDKYIDSLPPNRVYWQYRDKVKFSALVDVGLSTARSMRDDINRVKNCWDVNEATGQDLDIIGSIVNLKRPTALSQNVDVEHYYNDDQYGSTDQYNSAFVSAYVPLDDERYRILLKAKIAKNSSRGTMDDIAEAVAFITDVACRVIDHHDMTFSLEFDGTLTEIKRQMLDDYDIVPAPLAVKYIGKTETPGISRYGDSQYGESDQYNALIN